MHIIRLLVDALVALWPMVLVALALAVVYAALRVWGDGQ